MNRAVVQRRRVTPRQVLGIASLGAVLAFVDATIVNVAFPDIRADFDDTDLAGISWVLNAYNIVFAAFIVAAGRIAELLGRKRFSSGASSSSRSLRPLRAGAERRAVGRRAHPSGIRWQQPVRAP